VLSEHGLHRFTRIGERGGCGYDVVRSVEAAAAGTKGTFIACSPSTDYTDSHG